MASEKSSDDQSEVDPLAPSEPPLTTGKSMTRIEASVLLSAGDQDRSRAT